MSIKLKLIAAVTLLGLSLVALGGSSFYALQFTTGMTRTIVADGMTGLGQLTRINDMYSNIVRDTQGVALGELTFAEGAASVAESFANIDTDWTAYLAGKIGAEETPIVEIAKTRMSEAEPAIAKLTDLLTKQDLPALTEFTKTELGEAMESIASQFDQLAEIQAQSSEADYGIAEAHAGQAMLVMAIIAALSGCVLAFAIYVILGSVVRPLRGMEQAMRRLAGGDHQSDIPYTAQTDEIGAMAAALLVFRQNGLRVAQLTEAETIAGQRTQADRSAMMRQLQVDFGTVVDAAIAGDFSKSVEASYADAELNALAKGVNDLVANVGRGISETGVVLNALAHTDLTKRVTGAYDGAFADLKDDVNAVADRLNDIVGQLRHTSGGLRTATGEILAGANDLSERTTKQAAAIEQTSGALEQLLATVRDNAGRANQARGEARSVSSAAERGGTVMQQANAAMGRISDSSSKISSIIGLIDDIAFQTNLLALNASVEAARAGDAGKGFAVVAVEVRRLAQSAATASADVKGLIELSAGEVRSGTQLVADAAAHLADMLDGVRSNAALIDAIASASQDQSVAIAEVSTAIRQMDEMTQHNAALVEETNAAIEQTDTQASELDRIVEVFVVEPSDAPSQSALGRKPTGKSRFSAAA
jgi:methyl-accepting chemotaxis protein